MTVCVGAICQGGKTVVVAADRMLSYGPPMNLQAEGAVRKIFKLTDSCVFMFSGSVPEGEEIRKQTAALMQPMQNADTAAIAALAGAVFQNHKKRRIEDTILKPFLGVDYTGFNQLVAQSASSQVLGQVLGMIAQHNLQTDLMIAGVDATGGHLFVISHPGIVLPLDTVGNTCIGSGGMHASIRMSLGRHDKDLELPQTIYNVHEAKLAAEIAPGVGAVTDIAIIKASGVTFVDEKVFTALKQIHKDRPLLSSADKKKLETACEEYSDDQANA